MSNLSETGTKAFDYFVSLVDDPEARSKIETLLLDVERESFELGYEGGESEGSSDGYKDGYDDGYTTGYNAALED